MQKNTIVKISSNLQCQKLPEGIPTKLENWNSKHQKTQFVFGKKYHSAEKGAFTSHNYLVPEPKPAMKVKVVPLEETKVFYEKSHTEPKNVGRNRNT